MTDFANTPDRISDMPTIDLVRELSFAAEVNALDGLIPEATKEHIIDITNTHLLTSGEPRDLFVLAYLSLYLTNSVADLEFMSDEHVAGTTERRKMLAKGHLYGIEHLASVAFSGFGLRLYGVSIIEPEPERVETLFIPVEAVGVTLASR